MKVSRSPRGRDPYNFHLKKFQMLADDGGQLILLTGSSIDMVSFNDQVIINTIAFPSQTAWINLTTNGLQLAVDDSDDPSMTQSKLTTAFLQILGDNNPTQVNFNAGTSRPPFSHVVYKRSFFVPII